METRREERIGQLLQELKRSDKLHLKDAAALLGVSEMTIRRDLNTTVRPSFCSAAILFWNRAVPAITC